MKTRQDFHLEPGECAEYYHCHFKCKLVHHPSESLSFIPSFSFELKKKNKKNSHAGISVWKEDNIWIEIWMRGTSMPCTERIPGSEMGYLEVTVATVHEHWGHFSTIRSQRQEDCESDCTWCWGIWICCTAITYFVPSIILSLCSVRAETALSPSVSPRLHSHCAWHTVDAKCLLDQMIDE